MDKPDDILSRPIAPEGSSTEVIPYLPDLKIEKQEITPKPLAPDSFPDVVITQRCVNVLETIPNIKHLFKGYGITALYNVITNRVSINIPGLKGTPTNIDNTALTHIISLAKLNEIGTSQTIAYVSAIADSNQKNPVADWIFSEPWDGNDRLPELYDTLTVEAEFPIEFRNTLIRRWLISAVAAALMPSGFHSRGVLTLQGRQSIGKTSWLRSLVSNSLLRDSVVLIDHLLDVHSKDSQLEACSHWLVELGELESCFKRDQARLKGFITSNADKIRVPYARAASEFPRKTVFFATVNDPQFLVDATGNSRFWVLPVTEVNYAHSINMQQVWAQVAQIHQVDNEQWWLTSEEEQQLESLNRPHRAISAIRDLIESRLDFDEPESKWERLTASGVLKQLDISNPTNTQAKECGQVLREILGEPKKSNGSMRWLVPPIMSPDWNPPDTDSMTPLELYAHQAKKRKDKSPE